jgi:hypothetical protein
MIQNARSWTSGVLFTGKITEFPHLNQEVTIGKITTAGTTSYSTNFYVETTEFLHLNLFFCLIDWNRLELAMACDAIHSWMISLFIVCFLKLALACLLLWVVWVSLVMAKFMSFFGLHLPCTCNDFIEDQSLSWRRRKHP